MSDMTLGALYSCGCYEGPYSEDTPHVLVSVRCHEHRKKPPLGGHSLMIRGRDGKIKETKPRDKLNGGQALRLKEIKQMKLYD